MQTQRDHVHAHQFLMGRLSAALVFGDPASAEIPARRALTGLVLGVVLALLISVGIGVYGLIVPGGNKAWQQPGVILVEKETGTRFVYLDGALHPVINHASALLLGGGAAKVELISQGSLSGVPRGRPVGIPDAPQVVPRPADLVGGPWLVCLPDSTTSDAGSRLWLDFSRDTRSVPLPADRALPVESTGGRSYLVAAGGKFPMADETVPVALGMVGTPVLSAPRAWLDALPTGPELGAADIPGAGTAGPEVGGRIYGVGQLFRLKSANGEVQPLVLRADGLAPLSAIEFALLAARQGSGEPVELDAADVAAAPRSGDQSLLSRLPDLTRVHGLDPSGASVCLRQQASGTRVLSSVVLSDGRSAGAVVRLSPGTGVLAGAVPVPEGQRTPDRYLITDQGVKYPVPDDKSVAALGFGGAPVTPVAEALLDALPTGPVLSRAALT